MLEMFCSHFENTSNLTMDQDNASLSLRQMVAKAVKAMNKATQTEIQSYIRTNFEKSYSPAVIKRQLQHGTTSGWLTFDTQTKQYQWTNISNNRPLQKKTQSNIRSV